MNLYLASGGKKFLAYLIDMLVIFAISYIGTLIFTSCFYDTKEMLQKAEDILNTYEESINNNTMTNEELIQALYDMYGYLMPLLVFELVSELVIGFIYLVIIPYFAPFQTLGRAALKIRVVDAFERKCSFGRLALRELLGTLILIPLIIFMCYGLPIILIVCITGRSVSDFVSTTYTIDINKKAYIEEAERMMNPNQQYTNTVEPDYKSYDANQNFNNYYDNSTSNDSSSNDNDKNDDSDEYTVF